MNLNQVFNAERMNQRRCGHCGQIGHTQTHCRRALSDGYNLHLRIINGLSNHPHPHERTLYILSNMTVRQLKLLMHAIGVEGPGSTFMRTLEGYNVIARGTSLLRFKQDRITVMMWFYLNQARPIYPNPTLNPNNDVWINRKLSIKTDIKNDSFNSPFDCPICINPQESTEKVISNCNHAVCYPCLNNYLDHLVNNSNKQACCSLCRAEITSLTFTNPSYLEEVSNKYLNKTF